MEPRGRGPSRRFRALELLVKQKRLAKTAPVPCVVREEGIPEEDSLAENVQRAPLHPLDQFRAFLALREKGQSEEDIAAAFFVAVSVVKQRLRLASVSPKLLDVYADDGMTLDQLMAFTVNGDHERQEQVFERLSQSYSKEPHVIRRMLTEGAVRASDKRAQFIGLDAYTEAGGVILRDLFQGDDGGWLQDVGLLDMQVAEKLREQSEAISAEGWKWIDVAPDFAYGHTYGLRQLRGEQIPLTDDEQATRDALQAEMNGLEETYAEAEELPDEVDQRLGEIETALAAFDDRPQVFDPEEVARAGAFVSIDGSGALRIERGYVRPEDELPIAISSHRLMAINESSVTFKYKDYRIDGPGRYKTMTVHSHEFIRRFLIHVLPKGFHRIRHYGLLANSEKEECLAKARELLCVKTIDPADDELRRAAERDAAADAPRVHPCPCPRCGARLIIIETFEGVCPPRPSQSVTKVARIDTS